MIKKISLVPFILIILFSLVSCSTAGVPATTTDVQTELPPTQAGAPTSVPSTETPTQPAPTPTLTPLPVDPIQHYAKGQVFIVTTIHMLDASHGWAIGSLGAQVGDHVMFTTDGGTTWKDVTPPEPAPPAGANKAATGFFQDAQTAWVTYAVGGGTPLPDKPVVWRTSDGGISWSASDPLDLSGLAEIFAPSDLQFIAGQTGWLMVHVGVGMMHDYIALYRSMDAGASWTRIQDPYNDTSSIMSCTKNAMIFTDATHGWLTGDCGGVQAGVLLFQSSDAGSTWQPVTLPEPADKSLLFEGSDFACGSYNPFFFSNDVGQIGVNCTDYSVQPSARRYYLYTTQDGGSTWTSSTYPGDSLYFFSAQTGWALAPKIQHTTDGGKTWKPISDVTWTAQFDFVNEQIGWGVAQSGNNVGLVKTDNGGASWTVLTPVVGP